MVSGMISSSKDLSSVIVIASQDVSALLGDDLWDGLLIEAELKLSVDVSLNIDKMEVGIEHTGQDLVGIRAWGNGEFIKDAFVLVELAKLGLDGVVEGDIGNGFAGVCDIPNFNCAKVSCEDILSVGTEGGITDGDDDVSKEVFAGWAFLDFKSLSCTFWVWSFS